MKRNYDEKNDIFMIHKGFEVNEKFKGNIDVGDIVLDVSTTGRIRGLEIMNASKLFKEFGVPSKMLNNLENVNFNTVTKGNSVLISIHMLSEKEPIKIALAI